MNEIVIEVSNKETLINAESNLKQLKSLQKIVEQKCIIKTYKQKIFDLSNFLSVRKP